MTPSPEAGVAAEHAARALSLGQRDVVEHLGVLRRGGDRADVGLGRHRIAEPRGLGERDELSDEGFADAVLHQQPRAGDAGLAGGREDAGDRAGGCLLQVGVGEDDVGRLAPQLQRDALDLAGGLFVDLRAGHVRSGEGDLGHIRGDRRWPNRPRRRSR